VSNLKTGRTYRIRYTARNKVYDENNLYHQDSLRFSPYVTVVTAILPTEPINLRKDVLLYKDQVIIDWNAPEDDGGLAINQYEVAILDVASTVETPTTLHTPTADQYIFPSLVPGKAYDLRVRSKNEVGYSPWTEYLRVYPGSLPTRPGIMLFTDTTRNSISLEWNLLTGEDTGGTDAEPMTILNYHLYVDDGLSGEFSLVQS
jgi:hypothetical protein